LLLFLPLKQSWGLFVTDYGFGCAENTAKVETLDPESGSFKVTLVRSHFAFTMEQQE
jgi:hypothetical protein